MDTLMDKLASKLNAQEMIRANGEAQALQMDYLKTQVSEYQGCLDRLSQVCDELGNLENRIGNLSLPENTKNDEAIEDIKSKLEGLSESTENQLKNLSESTESRLKNLSESTESKLNDLTESLGKASTEENLHKEGVRIYKNIQASMVNELEPIEEEIKITGKTLGLKIGSIKAIAIIALCLSGVSLLLQIFNVLRTMGII
ncbi:MAG: hypothetical protein K5669_06975 [Lachnospiraceae bacterium]|nr:hypothetical protein [Lachnospiraceae bacterium]